MKGRCLATLFAFYQHLLPLPPSLFPQSVSPLPVTPLPHYCPLSPLPTPDGTERQKRGTRTGDGVGWSLASLVAYFVALLSRALARSQGFSSLRNLTDRRNGAI